MSSSYTTSESTTFTVTHAKHLAAKVATDLKRIQRLYGAPSDSSIKAYEEEIIEFLKWGYLGTVTYGFKKDGVWINPTLRYTAQSLNGAANDDDPGRIKPGADITGASFCSYLTYSSAWSNASEIDRKIFNNSLPFQRGTADEPGVKGYFSNDLSYSSGGRSLSRETVRSL